MEIFNSNMQRDFYSNKDVSSFFIHLEYYIFSMTKSGARKMTRAAKLRAQQKIKHQAKIHILRKKKRTPLWKPLAKLHANEVSTSR